MRLLFADVVAKVFGRVGTLQSDTTVSATKRRGKAWSWKSKVPGRTCTSRIYISLPFWWSDYLSKNVLKRLKVSRKQRIFSPLFTISNWTKATEIEKTWDASQRGSELVLQWRFRLWWRRWWMSESTPSRSADNQYRFCKGAIVRLNSRRMKWSKWRMKFFWLFKHSL